MPIRIVINLNLNKNKNKNRNKIRSTDNVDVKLNKISQDIVKSTIESLRLRKRINHFGVSRKIVIFGFRIGVRVGRRRGIKRVKIVLSMLFKVMRRRRRVARRGRDQK